MFLWTCQGCNNQLWVESENPFILCTCQSSGDQTLSFRVSHQEHWNALHRFAINSTPEQWRDVRDWLGEWQRRIPNIQCECRKHWRDIVCRCPPDFSSREAFFAWSVQRHNDVNARLGKPTVSMEEAYRLHGMWVDPTGDGPRVGFVSAAYAAIGGTETWHQAIIRRLVGRGMRVEGFVATGYPGGDPRPLGCTYKIGIDAARQLVANVDVLVAWGVDNISQFLPSDIRPKVVCVHHADLSNHWNTGIVTQPGVDRIVAVNPEVASELGGVYIPNAVDPARAIAAKPKRAYRCRLCGLCHVADDYGRGFIRICPVCEQRAGHAIAAEQVAIARKIVVWCARFAPEKRVHLAIDAARLMPDWHFAIIGSGNDQPISPPSNVTLTGPLPSQAEWLAAGDVFLSTASQEGFGYSMAEAMLAGVPVVATPVGLGANREIVTQLSVNPAPEEIASAVRRAVGDLNRTQAARQFVESAHSVDSVIDQWVHLIADITTNRTMPRPLA